MTGTRKSKTVKAGTPEKLKVMAIFGTRPDAVKMAPLVRELGSTARRKSINMTVCVTAQHREMLDQVLDRFGIVPDYDLDIMQERQTLEDITTKSVTGLAKVYREVKPDIALVHGDTTTSFAASLAAFYNRISVGHVEAGLRTHDKYYPYPEEINRRLTGVLADLHFAPTESNRENLLREGVCPDKIYVTGNTVIDAIKMTASKEYIFRNDELNKVDFKNRRVVAVTVHRRENLGKPLEDVCEGIKMIADRYPDTEIVYPVHLNPAVREIVFGSLKGIERIRLIEPVDVEDMHNLLFRSYLVLTDSGGLQEEAPSLGTPVLVARNETERPEAVAAGTVKLVGTDRNRIFAAAAVLLDDRAEHDRMARIVNPYGDGKASQRIADALLYEFGLSAAKPSQFTPDQIRFR